MLKRKRINIALLVFTMLQISLPAQNKRVITGTVTDALTKEPMPFATVGLKKQLIGIVTNEEGKFDLYIPDDVISDTLMISSFGYKHRFIDLASINAPLNILLESTAIVLDEIVIRAQPPEYYIRMAMRKIKENYSKNPFEITAYYREKVLENKNLIKCDEGVFKTYYPNYLDTIKSQSQLYIFRRAENPHEVAFMSTERKKAEEKQKRKNEKAGKKDTATKQDLGLELGSSFGGPASILNSSNISKKSEAFLDTLQLKSYKYSFAKSSSYNNTELMCIDFKSDGKVNHVRESGKIYINVSDLGIVKIENTGDLIIPGIIKPVLFFLRIGLDNPKYERNIEFQLVNGKWYPKDIQYNIDLKLTNKYWFKRDEHSDFEIEQVFTANKLKVENTAPVDIAKRFDSGKDMKGQVHNDDGLTWEGLNIIKK